MLIKKITAAFMSLVLLGSTIAYAGSFTDIKGHWAEATINNLSANGIINGVSENTFLPEGVVTRAEFLKMSMNVMGIKSVPYRYNECLEASKSDWFSPYLQSALDKGLIPEDMIAGFSQKIIINPDGTAKAVYSGAFNGNIPIRREEMAVLAQYTYQYSLNASTMKNMQDNMVMRFNDINKISEWALPTVTLAYAQGFIGGMDNGNFEPSATATRAQAATIVERMLKAKTKGSTK